MTYSNLLKNPQWQKKRLKIFLRDNWKCKICFAEKKELHVHHVEYKPGLMPWEYPNDELQTLCVDCHKKQHGKKNKTKYNLLPLPEVLKLRAAENDKYGQLKNNYDKQLLIIKESIRKAHEDKDNVLILELLDEKMIHTRQIIRDMDLEKYGWRVSYG